MAFDQKKFHAGYDGIHAADYFIFQISRFRLSIWPFALVRYIVMSFFWYETNPVLNKFQELRKFILMSCKCLYFH